MDDRGKLLAFPQAPDAIELRHLRAFVAVAEELNFGRAAARLYVSQPALSRQVRALEKLLGCELLRRSTHRVELTLAGEALLDRARRLLSDLDDAVATTQSAGGEVARRLAQLWQPLVDLTTSDADIEATRAAYETLHAEFAPPEGTVVRPANAGGVPSLLVGREPDEEPTILYLHGGGYVLGSAFGYRPLAGALAVAAGTTALVPDYRLAPEHPFPAAVDDARAAYLWMLERGAAAEHVIVAGDSAGGGLVTSLLLMLKQRGLPLPGAGVLFCPAVDLTFGHIKPAAEDTLGNVTLEFARMSAAAYVGGRNLDGPILSPLTADLSGLPPLLIQAATGDLQRPDAQALADHAGEHGVDVRLELYPVDTHVFHFFWSFLPEAADALQSAGRFAAAIRTDRSVTADTG